ncbi:hypothetical protein MMO38_05295 [Acinetobacter sp. NIPH 1852]|uniref:hypothetical protein n=1 Tax=Acinetobacter sp. NIPH 1852 TaxID=2923428 RepID=UPI001F4B2F6F|nr:hypothetical protein [Acinetobacter sp. NIPH 1852]MCH7307561.1 hypothetical protein [Acinetobacter sp. NIPH 1852]
MNKLDLCPLQESYSVKYGTSVERIALRGGFGRYVQTKNAKKHLVDVSFTLREDDFIYFRAFYLNWQLNPLPFLMSLIIEDSEFREYIVQFVPDSFSFNELSGKIFKVSAQLVVVTSEVQILTSKPYPIEFLEEMGSDIYIEHCSLTAAGVENQAEHESVLSVVLIQNGILRSLSTEIDLLDSVSSSIVVQSAVLQSVVTQYSSEAESVLSFIDIQNAQIKEIVISNISEPESVQSSVVIQNAVMEQI